MHGLHCAHFCDMQFVPRFNEGPFVCNHCVSRMENGTNLSRLSWLRQIVPLWSFERYYASRGATAGSFVIAHLSTVIALALAAIYSAEIHKQPKKFAPTVVFEVDRVRLVAMRVAGYSECLEGSNGRGLLPETNGSLCCQTPCW